MKPRMEVALLALIALPVLLANEAKTACAGERTPTVSKDGSAPSATAGGPRDACRLITPGEIEAIQGEAPVYVKGSERSADGLLMLQCFYTLKTYSKSVSLEVTRRDPGSPARSSSSEDASAKDPDEPSKKGQARVGPKERWNQLFHGGKEAEERKNEKEGEREREGVKEREKEREAKTEGRREREREEEESFIHPKSVEGVGREAFWIGNAIIGGLYVLKGDTYFRISIGGAETEATRLDKTKALARSAVKRLGKLR